MRTCTRVAPCRVADRPLSIHKTRTLRFRRFPFINEYPAEIPCEKGAWRVLAEALKTNYKACDDEDVDVNQRKWSESGDTDALRPSRDLVRNYRMTFI